jgi:hypothetical protein
MEAICSSETSVDFQRTTGRYIPEDSALRNHRCENPKSYKTEMAQQFLVKFSRAEFNENSSIGSHTVPLLRTDGVTLAIKTQLAF